MHEKEGGTTSKSIRVIGVVLLLFCFIPAVAHPSGEGEGYDENTEVTIAGTVGEVIKAERGPVVVKVTCRGRTYRVVTAPPWYLIREHMIFEPGLEIVVTGSKVLDRDGTLYLVSRRLKEVRTGREVLFRDDLLRPLWRGRRHSPGGGGGERPAPNL